MGQMQILQFVDKLRESQKIQEGILSELKNIVLKYLTPRSKQWVEYWKLFDILCQRLMIPESLLDQFRKDYEKAVTQLDSEHVVLKSYNSGRGGILMYPYDAGMKALVVDVQRVSALCDLIKMTR